MASGGAVTVSSHERSGASVHEGARTGAGGEMTRDEILSAPSMPLASPSYPKGPYRFINREYLVIHYESDPEAIRAMLPEPLEPDGNHVFFEWIKMPDSSGFGSYEEAGCGINALWRGRKCTYTAQMYLDDEAPTTGGREIWGFPKKIGNPELRVIHDTLTGTLHYGHREVALGTMGYKYRSLEADRDQTVAALQGLVVVLKFIPDVDGTPKIAQLVGFHMQDVALKGAWDGPARLHLVPHVNCRVADLPVHKILFGRHMIADLTLPYGTVLHDYLTGRNE
ncbi:acetoacetate decarboxylase [Limobrevibacterium gyesilva]|uniref:Acetoacetate decarboxylase n=1 Tax=Limobrevibacterium gyesilva TaxID=2991712 RepID=A0AA42CEJ7_9PROT|nr:acetoacetate decarboxylase [Limobrevibacterium gyesilva]MCW3476133.1 acetoacetate decarboxylase [Limobrevibacterium gyesilva]